MYLYLHLIDLGSAGEFVPLWIYKFGYKSIPSTTDYNMAYDFGQEEFEYPTGLIRGETFREYEYPRK